jgi:lambda family phage portal protein
MFRGAGYQAIGDTVQGQQIGASTAGVPYFGNRSAAGSDGSKWQWGLSTSGSTPILDHRLLRANARSAYHDTPQARAIIHRMADIVAYRGLRLEATPAVEVLGLTEEQAADWARDVEARFTIWAGSKQATRTQDMTFFQAMRLAVIQQFRDGEYFVRFFYDNDPGRLNPLSVSFVDANQLSCTAFTDTMYPGGTLAIQDGIERDSDGRITAYHIYTRKADFSLDLVRIPADSSDPERPFMKQGFAPVYAGQTRGFSEIGHLVQELENLTDFSSAHIKKAIAESSIALWVKPHDDIGAVNPFGDNVSGPRSAFSAPLEPGANGVSQDSATGAYVDFSTMNDMNFKPGGAIVANLQGGEELREFGGKSPSESYGVFVQAFMTNLAASMSIPVEVVEMKFGESFSASRAALILFWQVAQIWTSELDSDLLRPVYRAWLAGEIAAGRIQAPGWSDPRMREAWTQAGWVGAPMPNIDPSKTAKADQMYIEMGAKDLDRVARELNGSSGPANRARLSRQLEELPIPPWSSGAQAAAEPADVEEPEDEDENG